MNLVSIVLPANRDQSVIGDLVQSLISQSYKHWELLIVSRDEFNYCKYLALGGVRDSRIKQHFVHGDERYAYAYGVEKAKGSHLIFAGSRERYQSDRLMKLMQSQAPVVVDNFVVSDDGVTTEGLPVVECRVGYTLAHYMDSDHKPSFFILSSLVDYIGTESLLRDSVDAFYQEVLKESDGADVKEDVLYERMLWRK